MRTFDFLATMAQVVQDPEPATELLVKYTPFNLHMRIDEYIDARAKEYGPTIRLTGTLLVGDFVVWCVDNPA